MSVFAALAAFTAAAALLTLTPGLDTALVLRTAVADGRRAAFAAGCGVCVGCLAWAGLVAVGVGALLAASEFAYTALRWAGAAYLVWLGLGLVLRGHRAEVGARDQDSATGPSTTAGPRDAFLRGVLTNLLNPKVGVFYVSFLPQFVPEAVPAAPFMLLLGAIHAALGVAWFGVLAAATGTIRRWLSRPRVTAALDRAAGAVFIGFGVRLAVSGAR